MNQAIQLIINDNFDSFKIKKSDALAGNFIIIGEKTGSKKVLKLVSKNNDKILSSYRREFYNSNFLQKIKSNMNYSRVVDCGENKEYFWIIRAFISGKSLSDNMEAYDDLAKEYFTRAQTKKLFPQVVEIIQQLSRLIDFCSKKDLDDFVANNPRKVLTDPINFVNSNNVLLKGELKAFLSTNIEQHFFIENLKIVMGDLNPANILVSDSGELVLSDISNMALDNYMLDIAYFWLFLWQSKEWQRALVQQFVKTEKDEINFRLAVIRTVLPLSILPRDDRSGILIKRYDHWLSYLQAAAVSFKKLTG